MKGSLKPLSIKQIARQRIDVLFGQAEAVRKSNPKLAAEYVKAAQKVAMSARFPLPSEYKRRVCKHCGALLVAGFNCRVRIQQKREPHLVVTCLNCGYNSRILLRKKKERVEIE
ncbi:MAG: ribonuclease P protein component 4 [Candidatus Bathyarchaeia archaeon]